MLDKIVSSAKKSSHIFSKIKVLHNGVRNLLNIKDKGVFPQEERCPFYFLIITS
jgi:hypothetical protein